MSAAAPARAAGILARAMACGWPAGATVNLFPRLGAAGVVMAVTVLAVRAALAAGRHVHVIDCAHAFDHRLGAALGVRYAHLQVQVPPPSLRAALDLTCAALGRLEAGSLVVLLGADRLPPPQQEDRVSSAIRLAATSAVGKTLLVVGTTERPMHEQGSLGRHGGMLRHYATAIGEVAFAVGETEPALHLVKGTLAAAPSGRLGLGPLLAAQRPRCVRQGCRGRRMTRDGAAGWACLCGTRVGQAGGAPTAEEHERAVIDEVHGRLDKTSSARLEVVVGLWGEDADRMHLNLRRNVPMAGRALRLAQRELTAAPASPARRSISHTASVDFRNIGSIMTA